MTSNHDRLRAWVERRKIGPAVAARILRLNPDPEPGCRLRGWHPTGADDPRWRTGAFGKREFLQKHGRVAFDALPRSAILKDGRRVFVAREAVEDRAWERRQSADLASATLDHIICRLTA